MIFVVMSTTSSMLKLDEGKGVAQSWCRPSWFIYALAVYSISWEVPLNGLILMKEDFALSLMPPLQTT